jgi:O-antigen/teichoic acid export membrane protein
VTVGPDPTDTPGPEAAPDAVGDDDPATAGSSALRKRIGRVAAASAAAIVVGQLITMVQTVVLARILSPTEVGLFAAGSVLTAFATTFVEGGLRSGLVHRDGDVDDAAETVFRATLASGALMTVLALAAAPVIGYFFDDRTAGVVAASMAGGVLLMSLVNVPEALLQRQFSVLRRLVVGPSVSIVFAVVSVGLALAGLGVWSLVIGSYASTLTWVATLWWICDWRPGRGRPTVGLYRELVGYGAPLAIGLFADQGAKSVQAFITGGLLGVQNLGLYRYGERIAMIPVGVIVEVGANSLFPAYSRISGDRERFRAAYLRALTLVVVAGAAMSAALAAVAVPMVVVVLGEEWRGAGIVLLGMAGLGLGTAISTSAEAIKGAGRTTLLNWVTGVEVVLGIGLLALLAWTAGLFGVGLAISLTSLASGVLLLAMARSVLGLAWGPVLGAVLPTVVAATLAGGLVLALESLVLDSAGRGLWVALAFLLLDGLAYLAAYVVLLRVLAPRAARTVAEAARPVVAKVLRRG